MRPPPSDPASTSASPSGARAAAAGAYYGFIVWLVVTGTLDVILLTIMIIQNSPHAFDGYLPTILALTLTVYGLVSWVLTAAGAAISANCGEPAHLRRRACLTAAIASVALACAGPPIFWLVDRLFF